MDTNKRVNSDGDPGKCYQELMEKYREYLRAISRIGFAAIEMEQLPQDPQTPEELCEGISRIVDFCRELNLIIDQSPTSIYVADAEGKTLRMNRYFEESSGHSREDLQGRVNLDLEKGAFYEPSVGAIALKEGRRVIIPQIMNHDREFIVTGAPIIDENDEVFGVVTNAILSAETLRMSRYFEELRAKAGKKADPKPRIIAVSEKMQGILQLADIIKNTSSTILIEGETGVGKSLLARYIHFTGDRSAEKMTEINCGAIPPALLESELFGYVSGAFTGADRKGKAGLIEVSNGGTILLDEIGELPLLLQVKLLHFLQNRRITRVGGTEEIPVDVRVIAATNRNLEQLVADGQFREDLYYRLNVVPIVIPPLRERKEDIMPAVQLFADKYTRMYGKELPIEAKCIDFLSSRYWKGNLRELENFVERLVVTEGRLPDAGEGQQEEWTLRESPASHQPAVNLVRNLPAEENALSGKTERERILEAYEKYGSSYKVAKALGMSQSTAYRKIRKYTEE